MIPVLRKTAHSSYGYMSYLNKIIKTIQIKTRNFIEQNAKLQSSMINSGVKPKKIKLIYNLL